MATLYLLKKGKLMRKSLFFFWLISTVLIWAQESQPTEEASVLQLKLKNIYCHDPKALMKGDRIYFGMLSQYMLTVDERTYEVGSSDIVATFKKKTDTKTDLVLAAYPKANQQLMSWTKLYMIRHDSDMSTLHNRLIFTPQALTLDSTLDPKNIDLKKLEEFSKTVTLKSGLQPLENPKPDVNAELSSLHFAIDQSEKALTNKDLWLYEIDLEIVYGETWIIKHRVGYEEKEKPLTSGVNTLKMALAGKGFSYDLEFEIIVP